MRREWDSDMCTFKVLRGSNDQGTADLMSFPCNGWILLLCGGRVEEKTGECCGKVEYVGI